MNVHSPYQPKSAFGRWFEDRLPLAGLVKTHLLDYPTPKNLNYWWTFGGILTTMLVVQILSGVTLAMQHAGNAKRAIVTTAA